MSLEHVISSARASGTMSHCFPVLSAPEPRETSTQTFDPFLT